MSGLTAFMASGSTVALLPTAASQSVVMVAANTGQNPGQVRVYNGYSLPIHVNFGSGSATAAIPAVGTPQPSYGMNPGQTEVFTISLFQNVYFAVISTAAGGTGNAEATPGEGV